MIQPSRKTESVEEQEAVTTTSFYQAHSLGPSTVITPQQLRGARGLLDWTRADLAEGAKISPETVKNIEFGTFRPQEGTRDAILKTFAEHDIEFVEFLGYRLKTQSGHCYGKPVRISGAVLLTPIEQEPSEKPADQKNFADLNKMSGKQNTKSKRGKA